MLRELSPFALGALLVLAFAWPKAAEAQLGLPQLPPASGVPDIAKPVDLPAVDIPEAVLEERLVGLTGRARRSAIRLIETRQKALDRLLARNRDVIERDARGDLARRGELLATGVDQASVLRMIEAGFPVLESETIEGIDLEIVRFGLPTGLTLAAAEELAQSIAPQVEFSPDNLHYQAGQSRGISPFAVMLGVQASAHISVEVGMIDGAPSSRIGTVATKGFAKGAPRVSDHGTSVASLLKRAGVSRVRAADVYGADKAGGNALAVARAIGWLTKSGSKVISISLVGPKNAVLAKAIASARRKGVIIVAAVGNDGPAAPPAYPASYAGVVAITAIDQKGRALIEAGRALNLDYAAPGAGIYASNAKGKRTKLRGTSFATPLAAARIAYARQRSSAWRRLVDSEARDLGKKGPDKTFGRGVLCQGCARKN